MARGQVLQIASGTNQTVSTQSREEKSSFVVYNPNDGVCYFKLNGGASLQPGGYDWKLPGQSAGAFGGPWQSLGIYYLDQSGAGRQGEINLFDSDQEVQIPNIWAIGRSLQAQVTTLDVTEGTIPPNPASGVARLWVDATDFLHVLNNAGTDTALIDTLTALGGVLSGHLPNPNINMSIYSAQLASLTNLVAGVWNDGVGPSIALPAGTYLLWANANVSDASGASQTVYCRLVNSAANQEYARASMTIVANGQGNVGFHSYITVSSADTYKLSYLSAAGAAQANGGVYSRLTAMRVA